MFEATFRENGRKCSGWWLTMYHVYFKREKYDVSNQLGDILNKKEIEEIARRNKSNILVFAVT